MKYILLFGLSMILMSCAAAPTQQGNTASSPVATEPQPAATAPQASPSVLASGQFMSAEHETAGVVNLIEVDGQPYLEFGSDFQTQQGPDLVVILHRSTDVVGTTTPPAHALAEGDYVVLAPLQQTSGGQRYTIPNDVALEDYQSVAVWCRQFNATFGAASLSI